MAKSEELPMPIFSSLEPIYGTRSQLEEAELRFAKLKSQFVEFFGHPPDIYARSPGRVNLIGEHIDYEGYSVLPRWGHYFICGFLSVYYLNVVIHRGPGNREMRKESVGLVIGISIGVVIGIALAIVALFCFTYRRKRSQIGNSSSRSSASIPIRENDADTSSILSDSSVRIESPRYAIQSGMALLFGRFKKAVVAVAPGILEYSYKDLQKATYNFSSLIG